LAGEIYQNSSIVYVALLGGLIYALIQYFFAARLATAINGAHEVTKQEAPRLYRTVENLVIAAGLPMPKVYVMDDPALNAFATGRNPNRSIVVVTSGLLQAMSDTELESVLAHELGHVRNYDIRLMMIVFGLVAAIGFIADIMLRMLWFGGGRRNEREEGPSPVFLVLGIVAAVIAPLVALLVQLAISRRREYLADSNSALLTRYPEGLVSALEKIRDLGSATKVQSTATAHLFFANPLKGNSIAKLFSTHPPIEDRIAKLRQMENKL
jgi:heat shock protein HtpX